eukprot:c39251_g1_i1 orf=101-361(+)
MVHEVSRSSKQDEEEVEINPGAVVIWKSGDIAEGMQQTNQHSQEEREMAQREDFRDPGGTSEGVYEMIDLLDQTQGLEEHAGMVQL